MKCKYCNGTGTIERLEAFSIADIVMHKKCKNCNGTGEVKETNFQHITASPETLAELMQNCVDCDDCPITDRSVCQYKDENCKKAWVEWLKQESENNEM